jgi:GT2 family glycosyltransferase
MALKVAGFSPHIEFQIGIWASAPEGTDIQPQVKSVLAVVVLYRMAIDDSPVCNALRHALATNPLFAQTVDLLLLDNSPAPQTTDLPATYLHDPRNPGLAPRYNQALARALAAGHTWLLLFDQDTLLTQPYLDEVLHLAATLAPQPEIAVIVPKLVMNGGILSPNIPSFLPIDYTVHVQSCGVLGPLLRAYNSGALVRVAALQAIGGFPAAYPFDYLDHATFHRLQQQGGRIFVMHSVLQHELGEGLQHRPPNLPRLLGRLRGEVQFFAEHGTFRERWLHRIDLIRQSVGHARRGRFAQAGLRLRALFRLP